MQRSPDHPEFVCVVQHVNKKKVGGQNWRRNSRFSARVTLVYDSHLGTCIVAVFRVIEVHESRLRNILRKKRVTGGADRDRTDDLYVANVPL